MGTINILTESKLRSAVKLDLDAVDTIEQAFLALSGGRVVMPPIMSMAIEEYHGEVDVKTAYVPGLESFAIKMSPGFFNNPSIGLPSTSGLMVVFSSQTGMVEAVLLDNGYLTDVRTASAGAVAARHLSRENATSVCMIGAGTQGRLQLKALCLVRPITRATIWARDFSKAQTVANQLADELGVSVEASRDAKQAVYSADIVVTTTPATTPIVMADWLRPGQHLTAMGSDQPTKNELEAACLAKADVYVPDRLSQTRLLGELRSAIEAGSVDADRTYPELGDVVSGKAPGRSSADQITIADLTGTGVQDTAISAFARKKAAALGVGHEINN